MRYCARRGCPGHPSDNVPDCLTEAVWQESRNGPVLTTGSLDYEGIYTLVVFELAVDVVMASGRVVEVLAGAYLLGWDSWGNLGMAEYPDVQEGLAAFRRYEVDYHVWLRSEADDMRYDNMRY